MLGEMSHEERDEMMEKFRTGEVKVFITTNIMARGIDVPACEFVVNFDVPTGRNGDKTEGDPETYLQRISRTGRFGTKGIAITLIDRQEDQSHFDEIVDYYNMKDKVTEL